jgi:hypothetical protein
MGLDISHLLETLVTIVPVGIGFVWAIKSDTRVLKQRLDSVDRQLEKMDNVLVALAENKGRMDRSDDRAIMQGNRLDELTRRFNNWVDERDLVPQSSHAVPR